MMSLMNPVLCASDACYFYRVVFLILCICCQCKNQISSMMSMMNLDLTPDPLVLTIFTIFLCILTITLVLLVFWGLEFLQQQESSPNVVDSSNVLAPKLFILFPNLKLSFIVIVIVRL